VSGILAQPISTALGAGAKDRVAEPLSLALAIDK
jgi:hypothetical protein